MKTFAFASDLILPNFMVLPRQWWRPARQLDDQTFAAEMLLSGAAEQTFPRRNPGDAWFDFKGCDRHMVEKQSFLLPNEEVLTVLTLPNQAIA
jgi:hypothetical protein